MGALLTRAHVHVALQPALRPLVPRPGVGGHVARGLEGHDVDVAHLKSNKKDQERRRRGATVGGG